MATITLDTYKAVKILEEKGYTPQQAEGFVKVVQEIDMSGMATKKDIESLKVWVLTVLLGQTALIVGLLKLLS